MFTILEVAGLIGFIYVISVTAVSITRFNKVRRPFLHKSALFFIFATLAMMVMMLSSYLSDFYVFLVITEFLFSLTLFYNYLKSNLVLIGLAVIFSYMEDIMIILSIYFSFYITGSIIQSIMNEREGSRIILSSFLIMDSSFLLQAFYILRLYSPFMIAGILLFFISVIIFMLPFLKGGKD